MFHILCTSVLIIQFCWGFLYSSPFSSQMYLLNLYILLKYLKFTVIYFLLCFWLIERKEIFKQRCKLFSNNLKLFYLANINIVWFVRSKFVLFCNTTRNIKWKLYTGLLLGKSRGDLSNEIYIQHYKQITRISCLPNL